MHLYSWTDIATDSWTWDMTLRQREAEKHTAVRVTGFAMLAEPLKGFMILASPFALGWHLHYEGHPPFVNQFGGVSAPSYSWHASSGFVA